MSALPPVQGVGVTPIPVAGRPSVPSETAQAFEAMLLRPMVDAMVPRGGALGEGTGSGAWRDMLVGALADEVARSGAIGFETLLPPAVREGAT